MIRACACAAKRRFVKYPRLLPVLLMIAVAMPAQEVLTNDAIIKMVKARLGENVIVEKIRNSPGRYSLTTDNLIDLSRQGVPEKVILAMQAKQAAAPAQPPTAIAESRQHNPDAETVAVGEAFWEKILPACGDSRYYAGSELEIHIHGNRGGAARANNGLTEYAEVAFPLELLAISAADNANGVEKKAETFMVAKRWRERTPGQTTWQEWVSPPVTPTLLDVLKRLAAAPEHFGSGGLAAIELWKVKNQWYYLIPPEIDPLRQLIPASEVTQRKISCDDVLHTKGLLLTANGRASSAPEVHCRDSLNNPVPVEEVLREDARRWCGITPERWDELNGKHTPPPPAAPGHSLDDTYAQAQAIAQENASKGIRDSINPSYLKARLPLPVCYSVDATGNCQKSGETLWVPGDLAQPLDWNKISRPGVCRPPQPDQIEVVLKSTASDDKRKRYIRCVEAGILASVRKDLLDLGVRDDATTGRASATPAQPNAPAVPQSSPPFPGSNSLAIAVGKDAVTTRAFADPRDKGPGCEIPEGTLVLVQSIDKQTGKAQLFVLPNGKRDSKTCTNFLTVDRSDLGVAGNPPPK